MQRTRVSSAALNSVGYDADEEILELEFEKGDVHIYYHVPGGVYLGLMTARSQNIFFNQRIKGKYAYREVLPGFHKD